MKFTEAGPCLNGGGCGLVAVRGLLDTGAAVGVVVFLVKASGTSEGCRFEVHGYCLDSSAGAWAGASLTGLVWLASWALSTFLTLASTAGTYRSKFEFEIQIVTQLTVRGPFAALYNRSKAIQALRLPASGKPLKGT